MLLDPSSTFHSVLENIAFLRRIVGDGYMAAEFCRMIPYDGTPIKGQLAAAGRLRGDVCNPDYDFLDRRLTGFYVAVNELLNMTGWIHGLRALSPQLKFAWNEVAIIEHLFPLVDGLPAYRAELRRLTQASNEVLFETVEGLARAYQADRTPELLPDRLQTLCAGFLEALLATRNGFILRNQAVLLRALGVAEPEPAT